MRTSQTGALVKFMDGTERYGIVYDEDQEKNFKGKFYGKVLVTPTDEFWGELSEPKIVTNPAKLNVVGFSD